MTARKEKGGELLIALLGARVKQLEERISTELEERIKRLEERVSIQNETLKTVLNLMQEVMK